MVVEDGLSLYPGVPIYIQGDANVNPNHPTRSQILQDFLDRYNLSSTPLFHSTYHLFMGNGSSDSQLHVIICSAGHPDKLVDIMCKKENPLVTSAHNVIVSSFRLVPVIHQPQATPKAPRAPKTRFRVLWDNDSAQQYISTHEESLPPLLSDLSDSTSPDKVSSLLTLTNQVLNYAGRQSFEVTELSKPHKPKKAKIDTTICYLSAQISKCCSQLRKTSDPGTRQDLIHRHST